MSVQQQVNIYQSVAFEGSLYRPPVVATAGEALMDTIVARGVFSSVEKGMMANLVSNVKGANGILVGFAYKANLSPNFTITSSATMTVPEGFNVSILTQGSIWVKNTVAEAKIGYFVFVKDTDGTIRTQVDTTAIAGFTLAEGWKVIGTQPEGGAINNLICISNEGA